MPEAKAFWPAEELPLFQHSGTGRRGERGTLSAFHAPGSGVQFWFELDRAEAKPEESGRSGETERNIA